VYHADTLNDDQDPDSLEQVLYHRHISIISNHSKQYKRVFGAVVSRSCTDENATGYLTVSEGYLTDPSSGHLLQNREAWRHERLVFESQCVQLLFDGVIILRMPTTIHNVHRCIQTQYSDCISREVLNNVNSVLDSQTPHFRWLLPKRSFLVTVLQRKNHPDTSAALHLATHTQRLCWNKVCLSTSCLRLHNPQRGKATFPLPLLTRQSSQDGYMSTSAGALWTLEAS
jgi:hypothetical protein